MPSPHLARPWRRSEKEKQKQRKNEYLDTTSTDSTSTNIDCFFFTIAPRKRSLEAEDSGFAETFFSEFREPADRNRLKDCNLRTHGG